MKTVAVLIFGLIVILIEVYVIRKKDQGWGNNSLRIVGLTLITTCIMVLLTMENLKQEYFTSLIGLFGSIVGYLLGKKDDESNKKKDDKSGQSS